MVKDTMKIIWVAFSQIVWLPRHNVSRMQPWLPDDSKKRRLGSLMQDGWDEEVGGVVYVEKLDDDTTKEAMAYLEQQYESIRKSTTQIEGWFGTSDLIRAYENLRLTAGKIAKPIYSAACAFSRSEAILYGAAASLRAGQDIKCGMIPVVVREFKTELERWECNLAENRKLDGFNKPPFPSMVNAAVKLLEVGLKEADITRLLAIKRGTGQKVFALASLSNKCPDIVSMLQTGDIDASKLDKEELRKLVKEDAGAEEVLTYVKGESDSKTTRATDKKSLDGIAKNNKCLLIADLAACFRDGANGEISKWEPLKESLNKVVRDGMEKFAIKLHS